MATVAAVHTVHIAKTLAVHTADVCIRVLHAAYRALKCLAVCFLALFGIRERRFLYIPSPASYIPPPVIPQYPLPAAFWSPSLQPISVPVLSSFPPLHIQSTPAPLPFTGLSAPAATPTPPAVVAPQQTPLASAQPAKAPLPLSSLYSVEEARFNALQRVFLPRLIGPMPLPLGPEQRYLQFLQILNKNPLFGTQKNLLDTADKVKAVADAHFFHASPKVQEIVTSGEVRIGQSSPLLYRITTYAGAFVSTTPEPNYGPIAIAFKRCVDMLPVLQITRCDHERVWIGFATPIPVNSSTVACILVTNPSSDATSIAQTCAKTLGVHCFDHEALSQSLELLRTRLSSALPASMDKAYKSYRQGDYPLPYCADPATDCFHLAESGYREAWQREQPQKEQPRRWAQVDPDPFFAA